MNRLSFSLVKDFFTNRVLRRLTTDGNESSPMESIPAKEVTLKDVMIRLEPMFVCLQRILIWEQPYHSAVSFLAFNCLYWLFVWFNRFRFYSYLGLALFCIHFFKLWTQYIWPEIRVTPNELTDTEGWTPVHPQVLSAPEINHYINEIYIMSKATILWFIRLRREKHLKFFIITTFILVMSAIIGRLVPGALIVYSITMILALGPGVVLYVLPEGLYDVLRNYFIPNQNDDEIDCKESPDKKLSDDISEKQRLSESALHNFLLTTDFGVDPEDQSETSSLQLLSETQLDITLDKELGLDVQFNDDDIKLDTRSLSSHSSRSSKSSGGLRFFASHFSRNSSSDNIEDDYELISDSEIPDLAKGLQNKKQK
ncbi:reticulophagy regulator 3-like [Oppia nitens]|uniref:reticulophagy regulator 3-like n=1 Tax=Oppia nitens TaxID=1686743 RepID=UPI0023DC16D6|nr:reticulophagy regulator 3-like [Oppia nitens]